MARRIQRVEFRQFELLDIILTERELGRGSYAVVLELNHRGLKCAGKRLYEVLYETGIGYAARRYLEECRLLSQTRHPNIVQFLGVYFERDSHFPILVMEFLPTNLTSCLERYGTLPDEIGYSILHDVSLGLAYLHGQTPVIIHRDLSGNNVLLSTNMTAKISDLGVAKILNLTPLKQMTETPGTQAYMPPEVMVHNPQYGVSVDEFSFGALMIHLFTAEWPAPKVASTRVDPSNPHAIIAVTEVERREDFFRKIGPDHPLLDLITRCLSNNPSLRPHAPEIVQRMSDLIARFPPSFENRVEMLRRISASDIERQQLRQEVDRKAAEVEEKERRIVRIEQEKESQLLEHQDELEHITLAHSTEMAQMHIKVADMQNEIDLKSTEIAEGENRNIALKKSLTAATENIASLNTTLSSTRDATRAIKAATRAALGKKDTTIAHLNHLLSVTKNYLTSKLQPLQTTISFSSCADAPVAMSQGQLVQIGDALYYGGGFTKIMNRQELNNIHCYTISQNVWTTLTRHPKVLFGMGQINGKLVTVGGVHFSRVCNDMYQYDDGRWTDTGQPMPTARHHPTVISHPTCLIVAAGVSSHSTDCVEIFDISTSQWSSVASLPFPCAGLSGGVYKDSVYLFGGQNDEETLTHAITIPIDQLQKSFPDQCRLWRDVTDTPAFMTSVLVSNMIIAVGGNEDSSFISTAMTPEIHAYSVSRDSWYHIGSLPEPLSLAAVAPISLTEFVIIGGKDPNGDHKKTVYKATIDVVY